VLAIRRDINTQVEEALQENPLLDPEEVKRKYEKEAAPMLRELRKRSSDLEATKEEIQQKLTKEQEKQPQQHIRTYADFHTELEVLIQEWEEKDFADRKDFVNLFLSQATLQVITNHWIQLDLYWSIPGWGAERVFIYRTKSNGDIWTQALPQKSCLAIKHEAMFLGLHPTAPLKQTISFVTGLHSLISSSRNKQELSHPLEPPGLYLCIHEVGRAFAT